MAVRPKILVTRRLPEPVEARASAHYEARLNREDRPIPAADIPDLAAGMDAILCTITDRLSAEVIAALPPSVRMLATFSVGFEHIDLAAAKGRGLPVTNTPGALTEATADIALLLLLGAARRAWEGERMLRQGEWKGWAPTQLMGVELTGKRLGIVGMGRIGQAVARRAQAFGMEIHYTGRTERSLPAGITARFHPRASDMLPLCQFLSLHMV